MFGLTTCHGTVLCYDRAARRVVHLAPAEAAEADLVFVSSLDQVTFVILDDGRPTTLDIGMPGAHRATLMDQPRCELADGLAAFRFAGGYLGLPPDGRIRLDQPEAFAWERFGLVEKPALEDLLHFARQDWVRVATGQRIRRQEIELSGPRHLRIGDRLYPIAGNFPLSGGRDGRARNILFREEWMVEEFRLFRPLVFFVPMGASKSYLEQLRIATESLVEFGAYDRDVLVITDRPRAVIETAVPAALHGRLALLEISSSDRIDAVIARLMLCEYPQAAGHAPILYSDTDVVFDCALDPFLEEVLRSGRMSAQTETWNELPASDSCGGELFAADPFALRFKYGFNAGIWAMPGGADSLQVIETIRRSISRYLHVHGRQSLPWLDQAMANYVLRKLDTFDPGLVDRTTRLCQNYEELDVGAPAGFVHFWPVAQRPDARAVAMEDYVRRLRER